MDESFTLEAIEQIEIEEAALIPNVDNITVYLQRNLFEG
jgi:hypothetical protein